MRINLLVNYYYYIGFDSFDGNLLLKPIVKTNSERNGLIRFESTYNGKIKTLNKSIKNFKSSLHNVSDSIFIFKNIFLKTAQVNAITLNEFIDFLINYYDKDAGPLTSECGYATISEVISILQSLIIKNNKDIKERKCAKDLTLKKFHIKYMKHFFENIKNNQVEISTLKDLLKNCGVILENENWNTSAELINRKIQDNHIKYIKNIIDEIVSNAVIE